MVCFPSWLVSTAGTFCRPAPSAPCCFCHIQNPSTQLTLCYRFFLVIGFGCCGDVTFMFGIVFACLVFNSTFFLPTNFLSFPLSSCGCNCCHATQRGSGRVLPTLDSQHTLMLLLCLFFQCECLSIKRVPAHYCNQSKL